MDRRFAVVAALLLMTGCGSAEQEAAAPQNNVAEVAAAAPAPAAGPAPAVPPSTTVPTDGAWQRITLTGVTCGDNCYLEFQPASGGEAQAALCRAPICAVWFDTQTLPEEERGRSYEVQMGSGAQVDGDGDVMEANFPAITAMRAVP